MTFACRNIGLTSSFTAITVPSNWGSSGPAGAPLLSAVKTVTVPAGNPGNVRFHLSVLPAGNMQYIKNGGANNNISTSDTVANFANGDTIQFRLPNATDTATVVVTDDSLSTSIGSCQLTTS